MRLATWLAPLRKAILRMPGAWWVFKRFLMTTTPARILGELNEADIDVLVVLSEVEGRALRRGENGRLRKLARAGGLRMETVPHLEHSLIERSGRERVAALLDEYVVSRLGGSAVADPEPVVAFGSTSSQGGSTLPSA